LFLSVLGLFGAMLSTASTQLIAVSHTLYEDIISRLRKISLKDRINSEKELRFSRTILIVSALVSIAIVEILSRIGFSIADLVFAIYGAQLSLTPLVLFALFGNKDRIKAISKWAIAAVTFGFLSGWTAAITGQLMGMGNLVFLSPGFSLGLSLLILSVGYFTSKKDIELPSNMS
jgi:Na+/proline symporter